MARQKKIDAVASALSGMGATSVTEADLQRMVCRRLTERGMEFREQVRTENGARFDFMVGKIAMELKIKGGLAPLLRQLDRYAQEKLDGIVVVTTKRQLMVLPAELRGMPIRGVWIGCL